MSPLIHLGISNLTIKSSTPLLSNILPHMQTLMNFVSNTLPKPVLFALVYRLIVLHFASRILPNIGADSWDGEDGVDNGWDERPVSSLVRGLSRSNSSPLTDIQVDLSPSDLPAIYLRHCVFSPPQ